MINPKIFQNKQIVIVGLRGSGKTFFSKWLLKSEKNHLAIDFYARKTETDNKVNVVGGEYEGFHRYCPTNKVHGEPLQKEFDNLAEIIIEQGKVKMFIIDEANRIVPNRYPLPVQALELIDKGRGFIRNGKEVEGGITIVWVARRLAQLETNIVETADFLIAFKQVGKNDLQRLEDFYGGLADVMQREIDFDKHNFIISNGSDYSVEKI